MHKHMYIDESGDLGLNGSKYLVLSALLVDNPAELDRIIKNMRRNKFNKQLKKAHEIKANKSSDEIIRYMLEKLNDIKNQYLRHSSIKNNPYFNLIQNT